MSAAYAIVPYTASRFRDRLDPDMSLLLISYDLRAPGRNYDDVYKQLKSYDNWWKNLESVWIVVTSKSPSQVRDDLKVLVDSNDKILVVDISDQSSAWRGFSDSGSKWLHNHRN